MELNIQIGELADAIEEFKGIRLEHNCEVDIKDLGCLVNTPAGLTAVNYIIKKEMLTGRKLTISSGVEIKCADKHILQVQGNDVFADSLLVGDKIDSIDGPVEITHVESIADTTFYDIGIDAPHVYYDSDGILHHNTIITAALSRTVEPYGRSLVIVPNKDLVRQTEADYINLGLDVGVYYGDRKELGRTHTICTWQSLNILMKNSKGRNYENSPPEFRLVKDPTDFIIDDVVVGLACVIVDEVHMAKADVLKTILTGVMSQVPLRWGLTGTVPKEDHARVSITCSIGNVVGKLGAKELQDAGHLARCHVNIKQLMDYTEYKDYASELKFLVTNPERLAHIAKMIDHIKDTGNTLVLVDRLETGKVLQAELSTLFSLLGDKPDVSFISGVTKANDRKEEYDGIATANNKVIIATYGVAAVGINIPRIFNLVLIEAGKSFVRVIQSIGRGIRKAEDKDFVQIWDITSNCKFAKRHLTKRKAFYGDASYPFSVEKIEWR
jgi:superfamily II DNA or RNA helicase